MTLFEIFLYSVSRLVEFSLRCFGMTDLMTQWQQKLTVNPKATCLQLFKCLYLENNMKKQCPDKQT